MADDTPLLIVDPELEDRKEKFSVALMGATCGMIFGLVVTLVGLVGGLMSDQISGLGNTGIGMGVFAAFALLHLTISVLWTGWSGRDRFQAHLGSFLFAAVGGGLYFYAAFSGTGWLVTGFVGGFLFVILLGHGILGIEHTPPKSRKTSYLFSPFERSALTIVLMVGTMLGVGVGMNSSGHRIIGRGAFSRTFLAESIGASRYQVNILLFGLRKPYRLAKALAAAKARGLALRILVTPEVRNGHARELDALIRAGVSVRVLPAPLPSYIRPFVLLDHRILLTGAGGWGTRDREVGHQMRMTANLLSLGKIRLYQKNFDSLWSGSTALSSGTPSPP